MAITRPSQRTLPTISSSSAYAISATRSPTLRWIATSLIPARAPRSAAADIAEPVEHDRGQLQQLELAAERAGDAIAQFVGLDRREEPDLAEVDREHGHARARIQSQRPEDRAVPAEHDAQLDILCDRRIQLQPGALLEPRVLARLLLVQAQRHPRPSGRVDQLAQRRDRVGRAAVREHGHTPVAHGSTSSAILVPTPGLPPRRLRARARRGG